MDKMSFFKGYSRKHISNTTHVIAEGSVIWNEITNVMVSKMKFPFIFRAIGVPKPLSAKVIREGKGGDRVAKFSNKAEFHREILEWELNKKYRFKFNATSNFRVGHILNLSNGPFNIKTGGYELIKREEGYDLVLMSNYEINGLFGKIMHLPFRLVVYAFQRHLLKGIEVNMVKED